jgi:hypothetical protein
MSEKRSLPAHLSIYGSEAAAPAAATARPWAATSVGALLTGHVLRDGEVVVLILKPSLWFVALQSIRFATVVAMLVLVAKLRLPGHAATRVVELGLFALAGRVMWAVLQWMGRLYVLTDFRVIRLAGVFHLDLFDCPLRRVAQTRLASSLKERLFGLGTVEIVSGQSCNLSSTANDACPVGDWRTVRHPKRVREQIERMVRQAKQGGGGCSRP